MLLKCCIQYVSKLENSAVATGLEKVSFHSTPKEGQCQRMSILLILNEHIIVLISCAGKVMLKSLQAWLQQNVNQEFPDIQIGFRKGRGTRDQIANIRWIIEKAREFQKNICFIDYTKTFVQITTNCGKFLKRWEYQITLPAS